MRSTTDNPEVTTRRTGVRRRALGRLASAGAAVVLAASVGMASTAAAPAGVADDRFDDITGPFGAFVVKPAAFDMDADKVLADVPALMGSVDGARAKAFVESLAFPRTSAGPGADRQKATDLVAATFTDAGYAPQFQSVVLGGSDMPNVYAEIPGTQCSGKVLVVGAHYDSRPAGGEAADDNASGVGGLFEIARALHDHPLPVTVRLVAFSYEEDGLVGSLAMAQRDKAEGVDVVGALSLEMIGYTTPAIDPLTNLPGTYLAMVADPHSAPLAKAFAAAAYTYTPEFPAFAAVIDPAVLPDIYRSDHASYALNGYMGLMATDTANFRNPNYHTVGDTLDTIDWDFLRSSARTALAGVATYASSDQDTDGTADLCGASAPTTTTAGGPTTTTMPGGHGPTTPPPASAARPVNASPRYTG